MKKFVIVPLCVVVGSALIWWFSRGHYSVAAHEQGSEAPLEQSTATPGNPEATLSPSQAFAQATPEGVVKPFDPILLAPCTLAPIQEQDVSSQLDGQVAEVLVALGKKVKQGEGLSRLDDRKLRLQIQLLEIRANSPTEELIAKALYEEADAKVNYAEKANQDNSKAVPELELKTYLAQRERFAQEMKKAQEDRLTAKKELEKAQLLLNLHRVTSSLEGEVVKVYKKEGESVKQAETLFRVARTDRLRIEGFCKVQHAGVLKVGQTVLVEPERQGNQLVELIGHTDVVTDLAVSSDGQVVASAGADGKVLLWSWPAGKRIGALVHPAAVHAVDITKVANPETGEAKYLVVTGCEDGRARVWSLATGKLEGPLVELKGHEGAIRAVRIHPSGRFCATGGEDRKIGWWKLAGGERVCWVHHLGAWKQSAHQGAVTDLRIGPEGTGDVVLLSIGSDNLQKVWKIAAARSELIKVHRGRSGDVQRLGLSPDGKTVLFDHGEELRLLGVDSGAVMGVVQCWKQARFHEFACFSATGRLVLSSSADGRVQLWKTPLSPSELGAKAEASLSFLKQWGSFEICSYRSAKVMKVRCGAFAPDEKAFFTGGTDHVVRAWAIPEPAAWQPREAVLTFIGSEVEQGSEMVRIQAELDNREDDPGRLYPGTGVVVKIYPAGAQD